MLHIYEVLGTNLCFLNSETLGLANDYLELLKNCLVRVGTLRLWGGILWLWDPTFPDCASASY